MTGGLRFQLLWHEFTVDAGSSDVAEALDYLVQAASQDVAVHERVSIEIEPEPERGGFEVHEDGVLVGRGSDPRGVLDLVYQRVHERALGAASRAGWVRAHAALVRPGDHRILLTGQSGVGKTTLALRLLVDGAAVDGDESVLLQGGRAIAVPRPFHLKDGIEEHVPEIVNLLGTLPRLDDETPIWAFDPTRAGFPWEISPGVVDAVFVMERAEHVALDPVGSTEVMHSIVEDVFLLHERKSSVVREVAEVLRVAPCYRLRLGSVRDASELVRAFAD